MIQGLRVSRVLPQSRNTHFTMTVVRYSGEDEIRKTQNPHFQPFFQHKTDPNIPILTLYSKTRDHLSLKYFFTSLYLDFSPSPELDV